MKAKLEIAFFGSSLVSAYWNGAATYYRGIIRELHERGHHITFYEPDAFERQEHRDIPNPDWANVVVYSGNDEKPALCLVEAASNADLVVKASGVGVYDSLLEQAVLSARKPYSVVAFWDVDAPATLDRVEQNPGDPFRELIPEYDLIFTYGGGDPVVKAYTRLGARQCVPVYNALDASTHFRVSPEARFAADLAFLGNRLPDRETRVEEFFLNAAEQLPEKRFLLGGNGWQGKPIPANVKLLGHVYTHEHNALNSSAKAVLNVNRQSMATYGFSPPTRIFEAAGAAACIITDKWVGIEEFLEPGTEILPACDGSQVAEILSGLSTEHAREVGEAARRRILAHHTYAHRAQQIEQVLDGALKGVMA